MQNLAPGVEGSKAFQMNLKTMFLKQCPVLDPEKEKSHLFFTQTF